MYYIYEIKGVKVGCTQDMERRQYEQRDKGKMVLLETCTTIEEATRRERELQEEKGYNSPEPWSYIHSVNNARTVCHTEEAKKKREAAQDKIKISSHRQRSIKAISIIDNSEIHFTGLHAMKRWMEDKHNHKFDLGGVYGVLKNKMNYYKGYTYEYTDKDLGGK